MKAIRIERTGGPEVMQLVELELAAPKPGEVRIRHEAVGLNFIDTYHRSGLYPVPLPTVLGTEGAGVVEESTVPFLKAGDRVAYVAPRSLGSYAEARNVDANAVVRLPDSIDAPRAAAMMLKGLTVQYLLKQMRVSLWPGDPILFHAAAGGVGLIACQWAKSLKLTVIATAGSPEKCKLALEHGATHAIDYKREDVVARVREITKGAGVDVVFDSVGKDTWEASLDCLRPRGVMVSFGNASGPVPPVQLGQLGLKGSLYVTRPSLASFIATRDAMQTMSDDLFGMVTSGKVRIDAPRTYPLADAVRAHQDMEARATTGASVLLP